MEQIASPVADQVRLTRVVKRTALPWTWVELTAFGNRAVIQEQLLPPRTGSGSSALEVWFWCAKVLPPTSC